METPGAVWVSIQDIAVTALTSVIGYLPSLIGAVAVLFFGWQLARLTRLAAKRVLSGFNRILERTFQRGLLASARLPAGAATILGEAAFWVVVFLTVTIAARIAQLPAISRWLDEIVSFLPSILLGVATIMVGYVISIIIGEQVTESARAAKSSQSALLGRLSQGAVFVTASIIGLDQIGVDVTFLVTLSAVAVGAIILGFSIAFGLGARDYVSNLISARTARQTLSIGLLVRIGETQGEVLEITPTQIALDTDEGRTLVPARIAEESGVVIVSRQAPSGGQNA
ncbi:MAG: mechanosensitive ion channel family protein [Inquilinaceae bacterium]